METWHIVVAGRVQGVGFRYYAQERAISLNLAGYVRNLPDGNVEIEVCGTATRLAQFAQHIHQGPSTGRVDTCNIQKGIEAVTHRGFAIRY